MKIEQMNLKEKIGQLFIIGFDGYTYNEHLRKVIEEYKVGNVILFSRNIKSIEQLSDLNRRIHYEIKLNTHIMPIIAIDQEGGMVTRITSGATFCPGNMTISATKLENSQKIGEIMGEELSRLGINMNLAPSLDVNNNPNNPVIGVRSYSDDPNMVLTYGKAFIEGLQSKGIMATAKHFPGHGDTEVDSHLGLPVINYGKERLQTIELYPFKGVINTVDAIMMAHIIFKAYDENLPATLSAKIIKNLLRDELGYQGLIVSDCMEMKAIDNFYTTVKGAVMGIEAGLDMVCISHTLEKQVKAMELLEQKVLSGEISEQIINEKVQRILSYKEKVSEVIERNFLNNTHNLEYFEETKNKDIAQEIVDSSLTLVSGKNFYLYGKTLLVAPTPFATTIAEDRLDTRNIIEVVKRELPMVDTYNLSINEIDKPLLVKVKEYDNVVICSYNAHFYEEQAAMINAIAREVKNTFLISTRNPYDYLKVDVTNYLVLYEYTANSIRTITKYLKGEITPKGKLPVKLIKKFALSASVYVGLDEYDHQSNLKYLSFLKENGVSKVFISAHMPEANDKMEEELDEIINECNKKGLKVILDVSKSSILKRGVPKGIYSLRLDYGFSAQDILELAHGDYLIELNASAIQNEELLFLLEKGMPIEKLRISHNFYPKPFTGLSHEEVLKRNRFYKDLGLKVMAYLPSKHGKRPPIKEGLPTIEQHRYNDLFASLADLDRLLVDEVCFGDAYVSKEELETVYNYNRLLLQIPILVVKGISDIERAILQRIHVNRIDANPYFVRSSVRSKEVIPEFNTVNRERGLVTIDNYNFLRYQGEVSIMKESLGRDYRVNVVGKALVSDFLLNHIKPGQKFVFVIRGEM